MAPSVVFNINFENRNGYFPQETVKGQVEVIFKKSLQVKAITLHAAGISEVKFTKFSLMDRGFQEFSDEEEYYSKFVSLFQKGASVQKFTKGTYRYDFSFDLPPNIPSSFESKYGFVRHICKVILSPDDQTGLDVEYPVLFNVFAPYDLNTEPSAKPKIQYTGEKAHCCIKGFLSLILNIAQSGYVPGEKILINAECTNASAKPTVSKAKLHQIITYRADGKTKMERKLICSKSHPPVGPGNDDTWLEESMLIPRLVPSELRGCSLIDVEYKFKFQIRPSGFYPRLEMSTPIVIGTVSLGQTGNEGDGCPITPSAPSCPDENSFSPNAPPPPYADVNRSRTLNISLAGNEGMQPGGGNTNLSIQYGY